MDDRRQFDFDVNLFKGSLGVQKVEVLPPLRVVPHVWETAEDHEQVVVHYEGAVVVPLLTQVRQLSPLKFEVVLGHDPPTPRLVALGGYAELDSLIHHGMRAAS
jgi:hypothetical protein